MFGHHFSLITDHKPLLALLNQHKATSEQTSSRIRRWSLLLSTYKYTIRFRKTEEHGNADVPAELVLLMEHLDNSPVTAKQIELWTRKDPTLAAVLQYVCSGWPARCGGNLKPYSSKSTELTVHQGCLLGHGLNYISILPVQCWGRCFW